MSFLDLLVTFAKAEHFFFARSLPFAPHATFSLIPSYLSAHSSSLYLKLISFSNVFTVDALQDYLLLFSPWEISASPVFTIVILTLLTPDPI